MLVQFWIAGRAGRLWLAARPGLRPTHGEFPELCLQVSRGADLPAGRLFLAADFAVRVWFRFGAVVLLAGAALITAVLVSSQSSPAVAAGVTLIAVTGFIAAFSTAMMGMIRYRADRVRLYLRLAEQAAADEVLPARAPGRPQPGDFWTVLLLMLLASGFIAILAVNSAHQ